MSLESPWFSRVAHGGVYFLRGSPEPGLISTSDAPTRFGWTGARPTRARISLTRRDLRGARASRWPRQHAGAGVRNTAMFSSEHVSVRPRPSAPRRWRCCAENPTQPAEGRSSIRMCGVRLTVRSSRHGRLRRRVTTSTVGARRSRSSRRGGRPTCCRGWRPTFRGPASRPKNRSRAPRGLLAIASGRPVSAALRGDRRHARPRRTPSQSSAPPRGFPGASSTRVWEPRRGPRSGHPVPRVAIPLVRGGHLGRT